MAERLGRNATKECDIVQVKGDDGITDKERRFAECYVRTLNATKAYIEAGYETKDRAMAARNASRVKKKPEVKKYIEELLETERKRNEIEADKLVELLNAIANTSPADLGEIETESGHQRVVWKRFEDLSEETRKAIATIKNTKEGVEIGTLDRMKAIELLMRFTGGQKNEEKVVIVGEDKIED